MFGREAVGKVPAIPPFDDQTRVDRVAPGTMNLGILTPELITIDGTLFSTPSKACCDLVV